MKRVLDRFTMCLSLLGLWLASCTFARQTPEISTVEAFPTPTATITGTPAPVDTATATPTETLQPTRTLTPIPTPMVLPAVTLSPQEAEKALLELLRTNGGCTGKCLAGIRPDDMTVQEAVDSMAQWGMISIYENPRGEIYFNLGQELLDGRARVHLSVGTSAENLETIESVSIRIEGISEPNLGEDVWLANREAWQGFRFDNILSAYGIPSYVGYFFQTNVEVGLPLEGRTILYGMVIYYEQINLEVEIWGLAYYLSLEF